MKLSSEKELYLRAFELEDEAFLINLRKNENLFDYTCDNTCFMSTQFSKKLLHDHLFCNFEDLYLVIVLKNEDTPIGYLSLKNIDQLNKKAEWSGIVIDPHYSGKGYATAAAKLFLKFVFEEWNMNRIYGYWLEENAASLKMAKKTGFKVEGLLKENVFKNNRYHNVYICSLLKKEYYENIGDR